MELFSLWWFVCNYTIKIQDSRRASIPGTMEIKIISHDSVTVRKRNLNDSFLLCVYFSSKNFRTFIVQNLEYKSITLKNERSWSLTLVSIMSCKIVGIN